MLKFDAIRGRLGIDQAMADKLPEWFVLGQQAGPEVARRVERSASNPHLPLQVRTSPQLAHWYLQDTLDLANLANRGGMHANALSLTRQCVEAISVIELGICGHPQAAATLLKWESDKLSAGSLRAWLETNVWSRYGTGLWNEPWSTFMREFAAAVQPYAHYGRSLAQWQLRLVRFDDTPRDAKTAGHAIVRVKPRAYDPQKATRITLFHAIVTFTLGRIWIAANSSDREFETEMSRFGSALAKSRYLDGHETNWSEQFWALLWEEGGGTILE